MDVRKAGEAIEIGSAVQERSPQSRADALLAELLRGSPELAGHIRARVYGPLETGDPELVRTLDALIEHGFERAATAAAIPVHRNTLRDRLARITVLTGIDLSTADGCALALLAWLAPQSRG